MQMSLRLCYSLGLFSILCCKYTIVFSVWVPEEQESIQVLFQVQAKAEGTALRRTEIRFDSVNGGCGKIPTDKYF